MNNIGIIGMGRMGRCLASGWVHSEVLTASQIRSYSRKTDSTDPSACTWLASNKEVVRASETVFICVKPQNLGDVLDEISGVLTSKHLLISIVAGASIADFESKAKGLRVIRAMPNTPALVSAAITAIAGGKAATTADLAHATRLFGALGEVVTVAEKQLDAVTGLSGCGPAYVYLMLEALTDAGIKVGLSRELAMKLAAQTFLGASKMVLETGVHPAALRDEVTTPSGCTIEGLLALEEGKVRVALAKAVVRATARSRELREEKK